MQAWMQFGRPGGCEGIRAGVRFSSVAERAREMVESSDYPCLVAVSDVHIGLKGFMTRAACRGLACSV